MPAASLLERGFGTCFNCNEPLRSIALVDCFRTIIEAGGCFIGRNNPSVRGLDIGNTGQSLVAEAEDALTRARDAMSDESKKEYAISEFTHAINAINYLTSASNGKRLVLRAQDILIIAHHERAVLELEEGSSSELCKAIVKAYPRQSHRSSGKKDTVWHLTSTAFNSLFYPLPANTMVGSNIGVMLRVDMRDQSKNMAFQSDDWKRQLKIANMSANELSIIDMVKGTMPSTDGIDSRFDGLGGKWKGVLVHQIVPRAPGVVSINLEEHSFTSGFIVQFIHSFSTDISAREYTRLKTEMKEIGEETGPLNAKHDATLTKILKKMLCELEVSDFHKLHVLKGAHGPNLSISVVVTIGNVATKIFMQTTSESNLKPACYLAARAIAYLDGQLQEFKAADQVSMREALHHHPDLTLCAFCGKAGQPTLKKCSKCCLSKCKYSVYILSYVIST